MASNFQDNLVSNQTELAGDSKLLLEINLDLERENQTERSCLILIDEAYYQKLVAKPETILHPEELKYFESLKALKRKKEYFLGRFAAKHALLRLTGGLSLSEILIKPGVFQQPIAVGSGCDRYSVCISHSGNIAAGIAYPSGHPLGIDIEWYEDKNLETLKSQIESKEIPDMSGCRTESERYTRAWTVKESLSKVLRCGLTTPISVLALNPEPQIKHGLWSGGFENFGQYRFLSISSDKFAFAITHPGRTKLVGPIQLISKFTV